LKTRRLRLSGYEVFRFAGYELAVSPEAGRRLIQEFIVALFHRFDVVL